MSKIDSQQITTVHLKYGDRSQSLALTAFVQFTAKALWLFDKPVSHKTLRKKLLELVGVANIDGKLIGESLKYLATENKVHKDRNAWQLTNKARREISQDLETATSIRKQVVVKHFPVQNIETEVLTAWFYDATVAFFKTHGDDWVQAIACKTKLKPSGPKTWESLLSESIAAHNLSDHKEELIAGFKGFLESDLPNDRSYLMSAGLSMFASRLIAANIGADPVALEPLEGAQLLLDTNFIFAIILKSHRIAKSIEALGPALKIVGVSLGYLDSTRAEYKRVLGSIEKEVLGVLDVFPKEVVTHSDNDFIATAELLGCKDREDYERFFSGLADLPTSLPNGSDIILVDDDIIDKVVSKAEADTQLQSKIQYYNMSFKIVKRLKSTSALKHDASLIRVVESLRKSGNKYFALSIDKTLQACASDLAHPHKMPIVISVDALIQILALKHAGPDVIATDFAPLLASMLINQCDAVERNFTPADLQWLYDIENQAAELPPDKIESLARFIQNERMKGVKENDHKLKIEVGRMFDREVRTLTQATEQLQSNVKRYKAESDEKSTQLDSVGKALWTQTRRSIARTTWGMIILRSVGKVVLIGIIIWTWHTYGIPNLSPNQQTLGEILGLVVSLLTLSWWLFGDYSAKHKKAVNKNIDELTRKKIKKINDIK